MPPLEAGGYLIGYLFEIGPVMSGGMGPVLLSNQEIAAWVCLTGVPLQAWEARALRRLSSDYLGELKAAEKPDRPAPWNPEQLAPEHLSGVADAMRKTLAKRAKT